MRLIRFTRSFLPALVLTATLALASTPETGKLIDSEKQEVNTGSTTTYNSDKNKDGSKNGTAHTTDNSDTYQVFTIQTSAKTYVVREKLNFPWSKPANLAVGEDVHFTIDGNKMTIIDNDQKPHKASIVKSSLNQSNQ
jgi:hypothetical protein